jgi:kynurenine 3-monooxygenase
VNSRLFRTLTRAEHLVERLLPGRYRTRYELVSFTTVPYAEVARRVTRQRQAVAAVAAAVAGGTAAALAGMRGRR